MHMKWKPEPITIMMSAMFLFFIGFFTLAAPQLRVNEIDLSRYVADDGYVYYCLSENQLLNSSVIIRKQLDAETAERYRVLLLQIDSGHLLTEREETQAAKNFDGTYITFSEQPQSLMLNNQYYQFWRWGSANLCVCENYEEIYRQRQELTLEYLADDYEIVRYQQPEVV